MIKLAIPVVLAGFVAVSSLVQEETASAPTVVEEHGWLQQYVGEWDVLSETTMEPGAEPTKATSVESVRSIGPLWVVDEARGSSEGAAPQSQLTLGYDTDKQGFVGTWIDSSTPFLWSFVGQLDETKTVLLLETEGPRWGVMGTTAKYRERHEFLDADHRTTASSIQNEDGSWFTFLRTDCRRRE